MKQKTELQKVPSKDSDIDNIPGFSKLVTDLVRTIPRGRVMTYGQIASLCGNPRAARIVGGIAHYGDSEIPWQRVVNKTGGLATGYPGGKISHKSELERDGIEVTSDFRINNLQDYIWNPS